MYVNLFANVLYHTCILYHTRMVQFYIPYAYGTILYTIRVWYNFIYHTCMVQFYIPYAYGTGTYHTRMVRVRTIRV